MVPGAWEPDRAASGLGPVSRPSLLTRGTPPTLWGRGQGWAHRGQTPFPLFLRLGGQACRAGCVRGAPASACVSARVFERVWGHRCEHSRGRESSVHLQPPALRPGALPAPSAPQPGQPRRPRPCWDYICLFVCFCLNSDLVHVWFENFQTQKSKKLGRTWCPCLGLGHLWTALRPARAQVPGRCRRGV